MQTQTGIKSKLNGSKRLVREVKDLSELGSEIKSSAKKMTNAERAMVKEVITDVGKLSHYVRNHWKKALPVVAVAMVGAFFIRKNKLF